MRKIKTPEEISKASASSDNLALNSEVEKYWHRGDWTFPSVEHLLAKHPLTGEAFWRHILGVHEQSMSSGQTLEARMEDVEAAWPVFLQRLSWWELKRYFMKQSGSLKYKPKADIVIVHPEPRFTTAMTSERWNEACVFALMAYCNHGPSCADTTFADLAALQALSGEDLEALMLDFVHLPASDRKARQMTACPPHLKRNFHLGHARRLRAEERRLSRPQVATALPKVTYVFEEEDEESWKTKCVQDMDTEELKAAKSSWSSADIDDAEEAKQQDAMLEEEEVEVSAIRARMQACLRQWKVIVRELHNATLAAGLPVPVRPSWLS